MKKQVSKKDTILKFVRKAGTVCMIALIALYVFYHFYGVGAFILALHK